MEKGGVKPSFFYFMHGDVGLVIGINNLYKGYGQVDEEVPKCGSTNGEYFSEVEVPLCFAYQQPKHKGIYPKSHEGNANELTIFPQHVRVLAVEGVYPVENIVGGGSSEKPGGVGQILVNLELISEQKGNSKIDKYTRNTNKPKL